VSEPAGEPVFRDRLTARVLLLDPDDRILLMKGRLPSDPDAPGAWFTVGGGVEAGETVMQAAAREIVEETGFANFVLGEVVWRAEQILRDRKQRPVRFLEHFILARCGGGEPSRASWQALEREFVDDIRWWALADLAACRDPIFPRDLVARLTAILADPHAPRSCSIGP
jgi:8-oxo-dGTP pyrophosphatase MutT (NUDIX family)